MTTPNPPFTASPNAAISAPLFNRCPLFPNSQNINPKYVSTQLNHHVKANMFASRLLAIKNFLVGR